MGLCLEYVCTFNYYNGDYNVLDTKALHCMLEFVEANSLCPIRICKRRLFWFLYARPSILRGSEIAICFVWTGDI